MMTIAVQNIEISLNDELNTVHRLSVETDLNPGASTFYGRIFNQKTGVELEGDSRNAAIRLLNKYFYPETGPFGDYDEVEFKLIK